MALRAATLTTGLAMGKYNRSRRSRREALEACTTMCATIRPIPRNANFDAVRRCRKPWCRHSKKIGYAVMSYGRGAGRLGGIRPKISVRGMLFKIDYKKTADYADCADKHRSSMLRAPHTRRSRRGLITAIATRTILFPPQVPQRPRTNPAGIRVIRAIRGSFPLYPLGK